MPTIVSFEPMPDIVAVARDVAARCRSWLPDACVLGNIRAADLADLAEWIADLPESYRRDGDLGDLVDRQPNGLTERRFETAAWLHYCAHCWAPEADLLHFAEEEGFMTRLDDPGMLAGTVRRLARFALAIPRADNEMTATPGGPAVR